LLKSNVFFLLSIFYRLVDEYSYNSFIDLKYFGFKSSLIFVFESFLRFLDFDRPLAIYSLNNGELCCLALNSLN